jgi:hypothetical protein
MASVFVRACRSATIRTRLDEEAIRARLSVLVDDPVPDGFGRVLANGYILEGGVVGPREFSLDYRFNSARNPQTYSVHGKVQDTRDWRILRLKLTARDPWLGPVELFFLVLYLALYVFTGEVPPKGAFVILAAVMGLYAAANLLYIPSVVTSRVSCLLASEVHGSVQNGGEWVVPD